MEPGKDNGKPRCPRWIRVLLVVSLALNLVVLGAIGGAMIKGGKWRGDRWAGHGGPMTRALDHADRHAIGREMRARFTAAGLQRGQHRAQMQDLLAALRAQPFDAARAGAAMDATRAAFDRRMAIGQEVLIGHLSAMDEAGRAAYADRLEAAMDRRHKRRQ